MKYEIKDMSFPKWYKKRRGLINSSSEYRYYSGSRFRVIDVKVD